MTKALVFVSEIVEGRHGSLRKPTTRRTHICLGQNLAATDPQLLTEIIYKYEFTRCSWSTRGHIIGLV